MAFFGSIVSRTTDLQITTVEGAFRVDHHKGELPAEKVGLVGLRNTVSCLLRWVGKPSIHVRRPEPISLTTPA